MNWGHLLHETWQLIWVWGRQWHATSMVCTLWSSSFLLSRSWTWNAHEMFHGVPLEWFCRKRCFVSEQDVKLRLAAPMRGQTANGSCRVIAGRDQCWKYFDCLNGLFSHWTCQPETWKNTFCFFWLSGCFFPGPYPASLVERRAPTWLGSVRSSRLRLNWDMEKIRSFQKLLCVCTAKSLTLERDENNTCRWHERH